MDIEVSAKNGFVKGRCDESFMPLLDEFVRNFDERNELGASLCITVAGETLVDLWGGIVASRKEKRPWEEDTISVVFSCTKAATALCTHMLIDQGKTGSSCTGSAILAGICLQWKRTGKRCDAVKPFCRTACFA